MTQQEKFFVDVHSLVEYLFYKVKDISPLKVQKSLYFLYAYYGAIYGKNSKEKEGVFEGVNDAPEYLFDGKFEAWKYGPVIRDVYFKFKNNEYGTQEEGIKAIETMESNKEIMKFIDNLFDQINSVSDFGLVERSHLDFSWKDAFENQRPIDNEQVIAEYLEKYVR